MAKDWSNLKNQSKKVEAKETAEAEAVEEVEETSEDEAEEEVVETKAEKNSRENAEAKAKKEAEADAEEEVEDESDYIYFVNSNTKNLSTMVGDFKNWLFVAKNEEEAKVIRATEDFLYGQVEEMTKEDYESLKTPKTKKTK